LGNILINYTLEVYPSNVRNMAFALMLSASSLGSVLLPSLTSAFIHAGFSGFIGFAAASVVAVYFVTMLGETFGKMTVEKLEELESQAPLVQLHSWKNLSVE
jgi:hypothetical protein